MRNNDQATRILIELLARLHDQLAQNAAVKAEVFLQSKDGQFLGNVDSNKHALESLTNTYGPFGSKYSQTSIFNRYSKYGSRYGVYSVNNPSCQNPPELIAGGRVVTSVSSNPTITDCIDPDSFVATLRSNPNLLRQGKVVQDHEELKRTANFAYIEANDGTFLGKLNPIEFDSDSIFNKFGTFGSSFSPTSIFNEFSYYGGEYAAQSPFNPYSKTPPRIFLGGEFAGYLTVNQQVSPRIDPQDIKKWAHDNMTQFV